MHSLVCKVAYLKLVTLTFKAILNIDMFM